jgi:hypothetical protein
MPRDQEGNGYEYVTVASQALTFAPSGSHHQTS